MMRASLAAIVFLASSAVAQDADSPRAAMVARVEAAIADANRDGAAASERKAALDRAIRERWALMTALPSDSYAAIWMLDQAADELARLTLALDDARLVVGMQGKRERAEAVRAAETAYELARRAGEQIEARFERQRSIIEDGGELAPGDRTLNRRLAEIELAVRRPLLMGRAAALRIAGGAEGATPQDAISQLQGLRVESSQAEAIRDTALAIALIHQPGGKQPAIDALGRVLSAGPIPSGSRTHAEAALLRARLERGVDAQVRAIAEAASRSPFVDRTGGIDAALHVLAVEAQARVLAEAGELERAGRALIELEERSEFGGSRAQRASLANGRLSALAQGGHQWRGVAADVTLRAARALIAENEPGLDEQAMELLSHVVDHAAEQDPEPAELTPARELLARLLLATAERTEDTSESESRRARALSLVVALLGEQDANLEGLLSASATRALGPSGHVLDPAQTRALLAAAIERAPGHASAHPWRLGLAASLMSAGEGWQRALELAEAAMTSDDPAVRENAIALAGAAHTLLVQRATDDAPSLQTLEAALSFAKAHPDATDIDQEALAMRVAQALLDRGGREDAVGVLDAVRDVQGIDAIILRARAHDVLGSRERAFATYLEASSRLRPDARDEYWFVWTRLLELLADERRTRSDRGQAIGEMEARIRGYLLKLRGVDSQLGGSPWAGRLGAVERSLER
ncbi:MAG: hypothetical protein RIE77_12525 [Phycisphaerales bacterium]|jgi:hypothetical protein